VPPGACRRGAHLAVARHRQKPIVSSASSGWKTGGDSSGDPSLVAAAAGHPNFASTMIFLGTRRGSSQGLLHVLLSTPELAVQLEHALTLEGSFEEVAETEDLRSSGLAGRLLGVLGVRKRGPECVICCTLSCQTHRPFRRECHRRDRLLDGLPLAGLAVVELAGHRRRALRPVPAQQVVPPTHDFASRAFGRQSPSRTASARSNFTMSLAIRSAGSARSSRRPSWLSRQSWADMAAAFIAFRFG
jgi:hypothetical protein